MVERGKGSCVARFWHIGDYVSAVGINVVVETEDHPQSAYNSELSGAAHTWNKRTHAIGAKFNILIHASCLLSTHVINGVKLNDVCYSTYVKTGFKRVRVLL